VSISIGVKLVNENDTIDSLIRRADSFLNMSKERGRNMIRFEVLE